MRQATLLLLLCLFVSTALAISKTNKKELIQLMKEAKSADQVLSPDGEWLAYVKQGNYIVPSNCFYFMSKGEHGNEIWIINLKKMKKRLLVANYFSCDDMSKIILNPHDLKFSPDSKTLYFQTSAWVVSDAIHAVDVNGENLRFVTDGNEYRIAQSGPYRGALIVNQHHYRDGGDSYDQDWLFTPSGKQIGTKALY